MQPQYDDKRRVTAKLEAAPGCIHCYDESCKFEALTDKCMVLSDTLSISVNTTHDSVIVITRETCNHTDGTVEHIYAKKVGCFNIKLASSIITIRYSLDDIDMTTILLMLFIFFLFLAINAMVYFYCKSHKSN